MAEARPASPPAAPRPATLRVRHAADIHPTDNGWCQSTWHFTHNDYYDPEHLGSGALQVFNHDRLIPGAAWPLHPHVEIEGISYVLAGSFGHRDSLGNDWVLGPGAILRMSFGAGAQHAESNCHASERLHFLKLWITPSRPNLPITAEHRHYGEADRYNRWLRVLKPVGTDGEGIEVHQQASIHVARLEPGVALDYAVPPGHVGYLYLPWGAAEVNSEPLGAEDAAKVLTDGLLSVQASETSELVLVDSVALGSS